MSEPSHGSRPQEPEQEASTSPSPTPPSNPPFPPIQEEIRRAAAGLLREVCWNKARFIEYVRACDLDPTLVKVAFHEAHAALGKIAADLSVLGLSSDAVLILQARKNPDPFRMLPILDETARFLRQRFGVDPPTEWEPAPTLAERRAFLLVLTICDEQGNRILKDEDMPALLEKDPAVLDRLYTAAVKLNDFPLPPDVAEMQTPAPAADLTAVERAIAIYLRDPNQSLRTIAKQVGCDPSLLSRNERIRRLREANAGNIPRGSKSKEGGLEAEAEEEE